MAKSSRAKKLKRAEKAKVKFKVGKPKPKGLNVTDTSFKARKVVLQEQLKETSEPTTKRHLNLKDLLHHLSHYNCSMRISGLNGLQELLGSNEELLLLQLGKVIEKSSHLMTDVESKVRERMLVFLKTMFPKIPREKISPHFSVLSAHLCCAMTHIIPSIQQDSLKIFDLLIDTYPDFLVSDNSILKNFLEQISKKGDSKFGGGSRTLTVNPGNKLTSHAWRLKVLLGLGKLLVEMVKRASDEGGTTTKRLVEHRWRDSEDGSFCFVPDGSTFLEDPVLDLTGDRTWGKSGRAEEEELTNLISSLVPLMFETWLEVTPRKKDSKQHETGRQLNEEALNTLLCITDILKKFWLLIKLVKREDVQDKLKRWLIDTYSNDFHKLFMVGFPYEEVDVSNQPRAKKKNKNPQSRRSLVTTANLNLCSLSVLMKQPHSDTKRLHSYIMDVISGESRYDMEEAVEVIKAVLEGHQTNNEELLTVVYDKYKRMHHLQKDRQLINQLFIDVLENPNLWHASSHRPVEAWLENLPGELRKQSVTLSTINTVQHVAKISHPLFLKCLQDQMHEIIENLGECKLNEGSEEEYQKRLFHLMFWIGDLSLPFASLVNDLFQKEKIKESSWLYAKQILNERDNFWRNTAATDYGS